MIGSLIKINPLTMKGKNRINEGLGNLVIIINKIDRCQALDNKPAYLIAPQSDPTGLSKHSRWIKIDNDKDFSIVEG